MNITLVCRYPHRARTAEQVWDDLSMLILNLSSADPLFRQWWANPRSARDPYVPLSDSRAFVARVEEDDHRWAREFPGQPSDGSKGIMITNSGNDSDWTKRGGAGVSYQPNLGVLRFHVDRIEKAYRSPGNVVGTMLSAVLRTLPISFAQTNVQQRVDGQLLLYSRDRALPAPRVSGLDGVRGRPSRCRPDSRGCPAGTLWQRNTHPRHRRTRSCRPACRATGQPGRDEPGGSRAASGHRPGVEVTAARHLTGQLGLANTSSPLPVSSNDFRLDSTIGQPWRMPVSMPLPGSRSSWVTVSRTMSW